MRTQIFLRADGNQQIGHGHVARMLALLEILKSLSKEINFVSRSSSKEIQQQIKGEAVNLLSIEDEAFISLLNENSIVILDGYSFDVNFQKDVKQKGAQLVCYDDFISKDMFFADVIINVAGLVDKNLYSRMFYTQVYCGPQFAVIKQPFLKTILKRDMKRLLICLGGSDIDNQTKKILSNLLDKPLEFSEVHIVLGSSYSYLESLKAWIHTQKGSNLIKLHYNITSTQMAEVMSCCSHAITSASTIAYEYCHVGGNLYLIQTADNQHYIYQYLIKSELALPYRDLFLGKRIDNMVTQQKNVFNEGFKNNIGSIFKKLIVYSQLEIRQASLDDINIYYQWVNDPAVRSQSFKTELISWEDHNNWFRKKITDLSVKMYVISTNSKPIGQVRFEKTNEGYLIDYSVDLKYRGNGFGQLLLKKSILEIKRELGTVKLIARVKTANKPSNKVFQMLNFELLELDEANGFNTFMMELQ